MATGISWRINVSVLSQQVWLGSRNVMFLHGENKVLRSHARHTSLLLSIVGSLVSVASGATESELEWRTTGGDIANTRYSAAEQINTSNVKTLGGAWHITLDAPSRTPPVLADAVLFVNDSRTIYALDPTSGRTLWKYQPRDAAPARGGVAVADGLVFCGLSDAHVIALEERTGKLVWTGYIGNLPAGMLGTVPEVRFSEDTPKFSPAIGFVSGAPTYINGRVLVGLSGGDAGGRGKIAALDARDGHTVWEFNVIPDVGRPGADTWGKDPQALMRGGGAVWAQGAADAELGLVYFGTGNANPWAGGETRPGDNLYSASVVALDVRSGKLKWHYQVVHHDLWDSDVGTPIVLYTAMVGGKPRKALAVARTDGNLFLLDRRTGKPIRPVEERPVRQAPSLYTSATQPFPVDADQLGSPCVTPDTAPKGFVLGCFFDPMTVDRPNVLVPLGTMRIAPMAYSPKTRYFYVAGGAHPYWYRRMEDPFTINVANPLGSSEYGLFAAIDSATGKIAWQHKSSWNLEIGSGALVTGGGLVFRSEADGNFLAFDAKTGDQLWSFQMGALSAPGPGGATSGVPSASYLYSGTQFVVVPMGRSLWAFKLGGELGPLPPPPVPSRVSGFTGIVRTLPENGTGQILIGVANPDSYGSGPPEPIPDESGFVPTRVRVKANTDFVWVNRGKVPHTVASQDGEWQVGPIAPGESAQFRISKPGTYVFSSQESPWAVGQLLVQ